MRPPKSNHKAYIAYTAFRTPRQPRENTTKRIHDDTVMFSTFHAETAKNFEQVAQLVLNMKLLSFPSQGPAAVEFAPLLFSSRNSGSPGYVDIRTAFCNASIRGH